MRCAWCDAAAIDDGVLPFCDAHWREDRSIQREMLRPPPRDVGIYNRTLSALRPLRDVAASMAPIDWSRPVEGWTLFGPVA